MIFEKGHFHFAEKYWGGQGPPLTHPVPTALDSHEAIHIAYAQNKDWSLEY